MQILRENNREERNTYSQTAVEITIFRLKKKKIASSMLHEAKIAYYAFDAAILFASSIGPAVAKAT